MGSGKMNFKRRREEEPLADKGDCRGCWIVVGRNGFCELREGVGGRNVVKKRSLLDNFA